MNWSAARALDQLDWKPARSDAGARYWIAKGEWEKCIDIGAPAVEPLIAVLKDKDVNVRKSAAEAVRADW